jgi:hypothetical protein
MKLLCTLLGVFTSLFLSCVEAQDTTSSFAGFHYELIQPNTFTPLAVNVTQNPDGLHFRSIEETFGSNNEIGLKAESNQGDSDVIWVKDGLNWLQIYYNNRNLEAFGMTKGWRALGLANTNMGGYIIPLNTGFFIQSKKDFEWYIAYAGYVRQNPMVYQISKGFNVLNRGYPTRIRLNESRIELSEGFKKGDSGSGDIIWLYRKPDHREPWYDRYYYTEGNLFLTEGWKKVGDGDTDVGEHTITNTLIIQTKGVGGRIVMYPPIGFQKKKTQPILNQVDPPKPDVLTYITLDEWGNPYFNIAWQAHNSNVNYTTEIWDDFNREWWSLNTLMGDAGQVLSSWASIMPLQRGVARVTATWNKTPKVK